MPSTPTQSLQLWNMTLDIELCSAYWDCHLRFSCPVRLLSSILVSCADPPPNVEENVNSPLVAMEALLAAALVLSRKLSANMCNGLLYLRKPGAGGAPPYGCNLGLAPKTLFSLLQ